jgi:hypothetical protein
LAALVLLTGALLTMAAARWQFANRIVFFTAALLVPAVVVAGAALLARHDGSAAQRQRLLIVTSGVALFTLVQVPFAAPIYVCYVAPLAALGMLAVTAELRLASPAVPLALATTLSLFALTRMHPVFLSSLGYKYEPYAPLSPLGMARAGRLRVPTREARDYAMLVETVREHAGGDSAYIYSAPDAPQVYFLTGLRNPTRTLYDFFDDSSGRTGRILDALRERDVRAVAINTNPEFSPKVAGDLRAALERAYPYARSVADFEIRWR